MAILLWKKSYIRKNRFKNTITGNCYLIGTMRKAEGNRRKIIVVILSKKYGQNVMIVVMSGVPVSLVDLKVPLIVKFV